MNQLILETTSIRELYKLLSAILFCSFPKPFTCENVTTHWNDGSRHVPAPEIVFVGGQYGILRFDKVYNGAKFMSIGRFYEFKDEAAKEALEEQGKTSPQRTFIARLRPSDEGDTTQALKDATEALESFPVDDLDNPTDGKTVLYGVMYECDCGFDEFYFYITRGSSCQTIG